MFLERPQLRPRVNARVNAVDSRLLPSRPRSHRDTPHAERLPDILAPTPKPLLIAAVAEPGWIAIWSGGDMRSPERADCEDAFATQRAYFDEKLRLYGLDEGDL